MAIGGALLFALTSGAVLFAQKILARFSQGEGTVIENLADDSRFKLLLRHH